MGLVKVPEQKQWIQPNTSVLFGNIYETKNIDFSLPGFIKLSPRTRYFGREDSATDNFTNTLSIVYAAVGGTASGFSGTNLYYFLTDDLIHVATESLGNFGALTNATPPTTTINSDAVLSATGGQRYFVTTNQDISLLTGGGWTNDIINSLGGTLLDASTPHPLCVSFNTNILIGNGNAVDVLSVPPASFSSNEVVIPANYIVQWIRTYSSSVWIGTRCVSNGNAKVYQWDGYSENFNYEYEVDCQWVYSGVEWKGNFYIVTNDGRLMAFNGGGFTEVARLPSYTNIITTNNYSFGNAFSLGSIAQRGVAVVDGKIHILVNAQATNDAGTVEAATTKLMSGIWVYDEGVGFYNKYTLSNSNAAIDFGQMGFAGGAGALAPVNLDPTAASPISSSVGGTLLYGAFLNSASSTNYYTAGSVTSGANRGYFTTSRIESPEIQESWRYVWLKFEEFENETDAIVVRYRTRYKDGLPFTTASTVTWTSSTTFTSTNTGFANVEAGDEVTVITGDDAGAVVNVSSITEAGGTYTVTVDETMTNIANNDIGKVALSNFHRLSPSITTANIDNVNVGSRFAKIPIPIVTASDNQPAPSEWLELKIEMRGENVKLSELAVLSETQMKTII